MKKILLGVSLIFTNLIIAKPFSGIGLEIPFNNKVNCKVNPKVGLQLLIKESSNVKTIENILTNKSTRQINQKKVEQFKYAAAYKHNYLPKAIIPFREFFFKNIHQKNYFNILGIPTTSTESDIKNAYNVLARQHHPDKGGNREKFEEITAAYRILTREPASIEEVIIDIETRKIENILKKIIEKKKQQNQQELNNRKMSFINTLLNSFRNKAKQQFLEQQRLNAVKEVARAQVLKEFQRQETINNAYNAIFGGTYTGSKKD